MQLVKLRKSTIQKLQEVPDSLDFILLKHTKIIRIDERQAQTSQTAHTKRERGREEERKGGREGGKQRQQAFQKTLRHNEMSRRGLKQL